LSYTRVRPINYHGTQPVSTAMQRALETASVPGVFRAGQALNRRRFAAYTDVSINNEKEVIQCLTPSAVTSLGSPAKLLTLCTGALPSAWTSEKQKLGRDGSNPVAFFI